MFSWLGWVAKDAEYFGSPNAVSLVFNVWSISDFTNWTKWELEWCVCCVCCIKLFNIYVPNHVVNGHDFRLHSGWWLWTVVFLCLGPVWNHFWSAELPSSATPKSTPRPQRLRLRSKVGWPKASRAERVELDVARWVGFLKISLFFSKTLGSRVPRCLQTLPFHGWQILAARSSKIIQDRLIIFSRASCGICWAFPDFWSMAESSNEIHGLNMFKLQTGFRAGSDTEEEEEEHISVMLIMLYNPGNAAAPPSTPVSAYKPDWILT